MPVARLFNVVCIELPYECVSGRYDFHQMELRHPFKPMVLVEDQPAISFKHYHLDLI